ncbi:unnamed protein product [Echinostoma caproni]|uniref:RRM domain-containing protein n=1 Tax=Echinostoma caproni TaxID=27848 RepID=A0A183A5J4_9TREM|nr:unnamed protein product [Echinostoma caproni]
MAEKTPSRPIAVTTTAATTTATTTATTAEPVYSEQDEHVTESRRTCSSTDSGRSSISSSQTSHCDVDSADKSGLTTHIDHLLTVDKASSSEHNVINSAPNDLVEDLDMYADVTLIPKSTSTLVFHPKESKVHTKRASRTKGGKSSKSRKQTTSKSVESNEPSTKNLPSQMDSHKSTSKEQKSVSSKACEVNTAVSTSNSTEASESVDSSTLVPSKSKCLTVAELRRNRKHYLVRERRLRSMKPLTPLTQPRKELMDYCSTQEKEETKAIHSHPVNSVESCAIQPDTTGPEPSPTSVTSASPKHVSRSITHGTQPQTLDVEKPDVKFCSYSSSSSPLPNSGPKIRASLSNKRRPRAGGSPVSTSNSSIGKPHFLQRAGKSVPIRPLLPMELQHNHPLCTVTHRKQWTDRNNKRVVQNSALLPNPLFQSTNCLCVQHMDASGMLINQPLYWLLPGFQFNHYAQTSDTGIRNATGDVKQSSQQFSPMAQTDGPTLLPSSWHQTANPYGGPDFSGGNFGNTNELCGQLVGIQLPPDSKLHSGKNYCVQKTSLSAKGSSQELPSVSVQTEDMSKGTGDMPVSTDGLNQLERKTNRTDALDVNKNVTRQGDLKANPNREADDGTSTYISSLSTKPRSLLTVGDGVRQGNSCSVAVPITGSESTDISRSYILGAGIPDGNATTGPIMPNVITYNNNGDSCVMPTSFIYVYSADGQLFAIPSTAMLYPTPTVPSADVGSGSDSAYSSPPAVLSAQAVHEAANLHQAYTATTNFDIPTGVIGTAQDLNSANTLTPHYEPMCTNQLTLPGQIPSSYPPEVNQWSGCTLPVDSEHASGMNPPPQNQNPIRPILISSQNANIMMQNALALSGQYMSGSMTSNQIPASIIGSGERNGKESLAVQSLATIRSTQHSQPLKISENGKNQKPNFESQSGLLGHAKAGGSILGDSKSMILHSMPSFMDDLARNGSNVQISHARQKKHSSKTNLYIRGLPSTFTEEQLHTLAPDKELIRSVKLISGTEGEMYGFIDFTSNVAARAALLHIKSNNRELYVNFAYESEKDPHNVYITNIPETWTAGNVEDLKKIFQPYGQIATAIVMTKRSNNFCTGAGFVRFVRAEDAQRAIEGIRTAQIKLDGGKGPLEVKLADRQKPVDDQSSSSKSRTSKSLNDGNPHGSDGSIETQTDTFRHSNNQCVKKTSGCLLAADPVAPLLGLALNAGSPGNPRSTSAAPVGPGLLSNANNFNVLSRLNNPASFAMAIQSALSNAPPLVHSNLLLQNPLHAINFSISMPNDSQSVNQANLLPYRAQASHVANLLSQPRGPRINTGLLQNPPLPTTALFPNQTGLIPMVRGPVDEISYNSPSIGVSGTQSQSAILGHGDMRRVVSNSRCDEWEWGSCCSSLPCRYGKKEVLL